MARINKYLPILDDYGTRIKEEIRFALSLAEHEESNNWKNLILNTVNCLETEIKNGEAPDKAVKKAEEKLSEIGERASEYTIHYIAHAHIDMNWLWNLPDTVMTSYDTFSAMDDLMEEFQNFHFSQSQASTYKAMEEECPEMFETIKKRVENGNWEITASTWVEGDKNMGSGESQVRQILYAKNYFAEKFDIESGDLKLDWEPDTFGHPATTPKILQDAGIDYYYLHRPGDKRAVVPRLFNWRSSDGSEVLVWNDQKLTYNNHVREREVSEVLKFESETGIKEYMIVYDDGSPKGEEVRKIGGEIEGTKANSEVAILSPYEQRWSM
ncbi:hypothetical protein AKJ65_07595, partial [candidate division MSBL1 archaeon SCGC-AAA259E19]